MIKQISEEQPKSAEKQDYQKSVKISKINSTIKQPISPNSIQHQLPLTIDSKIDNSSSMKVKNIVIRGSTDEIRKILENELHSTVAKSDVVIKFLKSSILINIAKENYDILYPRLTEIIKRHVRTFRFSKYKINAIELALKLTWINLSAIQEIYNAKVMLVKVGSLDNQCFELTVCARNRAGFVMNSLITHLMGFSVLKLKGVEQTMFLKSHLSKIDRLRTYPVTGGDVITTEADDEWPIYMKNN